MTKDEIKLRVVNYVTHLVDDIMPADSLVGKMKNATAKLWIQQNSYRLDSILDPFMDCNGCIDENMLVQHYEDALFEDGEFRVDIHKMIPEEYSTIRAFIPGKIVVFKKHDLYQLLGM